jgi:AcrR family transcriptional regulator
MECDPEVTSDAVAFHDASGRYDAPVSVSLTEKARITRAALVRSAYELFVEQGYGAVSVRDLARRTHVTSGAIYGHFRNKGDLLVAAIADHLDRDLEEPSRRNLDFRTVIARQWRAYRSRAGMRALLVEGAAAARVDEEVRSKLHELQSARIADWKRIYHDIQEQQGIDPDIDMDALLIMLWATELGLGVLEAWEVDLPKPATWGRLIDRVLHSLEARV